MSAVSDIALIALFILIGGTFAAAEMALVTLRESQIRQLAAKGKRGRAIKRLTSDPNRFLSAVQIGVTLSGFLSAAFGGATLAAGLAPVFENWGMPASVADPLALVIITIVISYFSIVIGELSAKRLAMNTTLKFFTQKSTVRIFSGLNSFVNINKPFKHLMIGFCFFHIYNYSRKKRFGDRNILIFYSLSRG